MAATSWADPGLVFPNTKGKIRRRDSVVRSLRRFLEEAALPVEVRFHVLRHSDGTLALRRDVPLHTVSKMLGHAGPAMTTLRRYGHVLENMREADLRWVDLRGRTVRGQPERGHHAQRVEAPVKAEGN